MVGRSATVTESSTAPKSFRGEFVFNKHGCRWRAEMWRFESVLEDIDSTLLLKEKQRNAIKAFVDRKVVFAVLPTGSGKSLMYQLAPWSTLWSYYIALIGSRYIQLSEETFFFLVRLKHAPLERYQTHILTRIMSMTTSG